jgi:hypothetical protein
MIRAHVTAVVGLLDAVANLTVYDGEVPNTPTLPYVVVFSDQGPATRTGFEAVSDRRDFTFQTSAVGSTPEQARWAAEKTSAALLDVTPTVASRTCWPITHLGSQPTRPDLDVDPPVYLAVDQWRLPSIPA